MLVTGNSQIAILRAAETLYQNQKTVYHQTVAEISVEIGKVIRELSNKPEGYFMSTGGWHAIRLLEHDPNDKSSEASVYIGLNVLEYQLNPDMYHYVTTKGSEWEYIDTPEIAEEDQN